MLTPISRTSYSFTRSKSIILSKKDFSIAKAAFESVDKKKWQTAIKLTKKAKDKGSDVSSTYDDSGKGSGIKDESVLSPEDLFEIIDTSKDNYINAKEIDILLIAGIIFIEATVYKEIKGTSETS